MKNEDFVRVDCYQCMSGCHRFVEVTVGLRDPVEVGWHVGDEFTIPAELQVLVEQGELTAHEASEVEKCIDKTAWPRK